MRMCFPAGAIPIEPADGKCRHFLGERFGMLPADALLDPGQTDARNAGWHAREVLGHHGTRQSHGFEIVAGAIGRDDRDAHLRDDLEQAGTDAVHVALHAFAQPPAAEQATGMPIGNAFLCQPGVDSRRTNANQNCEVMRIDAFRRTNIQRRERPELRADKVRVHGAGGEDHRNCGYRRTNAFIREDQVGIAAADCFLGLRTDLVECCLEGAFLGLPVADIECAVDLEEAVLEVLLHAVIHAG